MSYGSPSQWKHGKEEVDTTVPENPIHRKLEELRETVMTLNQTLAWQRANKFAQSVIDQIAALRRNGWKERIDLYVDPTVFIQEQLDALRNLGEVNVKGSAREIKIPNMEKFRADIRKIFSNSSKFPRIES